MVLFFNIRLHYYYFENKTYFKNPSLTKERKKKILQVDQAADNLYNEDDCTACAMQEKDWKSNQLQSVIPSY